MPGSLASPRRLPGVRFEVPPRTLDDTVPRMDVALFVGFAPSGPLGLPVAVESPAEFEAVFGTGLVLARDVVTGEPVRGLLHPSVRSFFSQGGRRCWVQRVAGSGVRARVFSLPALLLARRPPRPGVGGAARPEAEPAWHLSPATLVASSPGRGADGVRVAARVGQGILRAKPLASHDEAVLHLSVPESTSAGVRVGDLMRVTLDEVWVHGRVEAIEAAAPAAGDAPTRRLVLQGLVALRRTEIHSPSLELMSVTLLGLDAIVSPALLTLDLDATVSPALPTERSAHGEWLPDGRLAATCRVPVTRLPQPDEVAALRFDTVGQHGFMALDEVEVTEATDLGGEVEVRLSGRPFLDGRDAWPSAVAAWRARGEERLVAWLRLDLRARRGVEADLTLEGLGMATPAQAPGQGSSVFDLPDDEHLFSSSASVAIAGGTMLSVEQRDDRGRLRGRFPLAAPPLSGELMLLPLGELPGFGAGLGPVYDSAPPLERDGLTEFSWRLFAEPALATCSSDALADRAEAMRHAGREPVPLRGMHVAFGGDVAGLADEPTLLAVPDAVHPGWSPVSRPEAVWTKLAELPAPPDPCAGETFIECDALPLAPPRFVGGADSLADSRFTLHWTHVADGADYELEESTEAGFGIATQVYQGAATRFTVLGKHPGVLYYRVRARLGLRRSAWSRRPVRIHIGVQGYETRAWTSTDLLAIHRLMLRTAAGHGDMLSVLILPHHFDGAAAAAHAAALSSTRRELDADATAPMAIGVDEVRALSHGALYHPWLTIRREEDVIVFPPDGSVCGQLAAGALDRGAWLAVANRPLRDVVAVDALGTRPSPAQRQQLLEAQVNLVLATPHGFVLSTADTLSPEPEWRPINVRRLMSLLRRLALRRGATYVFEPNGATLRRTVERGFEAVLEDLFRRGAFAGGRRESAYRVEVGDEVNTDRRRDLGQFWVELKVAPALPLEFLTVRLSRHGERVISREAH